MDSIAVQKHELPPTNQKRMVAFINHFIVSTVTFLNKFASDCENRFVNLEHKIQNLEATLMIVEAKLASIDVLKQPGSTPVVEAKRQDTSDQPSAVIATESEAKALGANEPQPEKTTIPQVPERDPQYDLYFKMLHLGVPLGAVKNKICSEGLDPDYIDRFL